MARWGGDEFILGIVNCENFDKSEICRECPIHKRISEAVKKLGEKYKVPLNVSCGIAKIPLETENLEDALKLADKSLYAAKRKGKGKVKVD